MIFLSCSFRAVYLPLPRRKGYFQYIYSSTNCINVCASREFLTVIARLKQLPYFWASILRCDVIRAWSLPLFRFASDYCFPFLFTASLVCWQLPSFERRSYGWRRTCMIIARSLPLSQFANDNSPRFTRSSRLYVVTFSLPLRSCVDSCRLLNVDLTGDVERAWSLPGHCRCHNLRMVILLASLVAPAYTLSRLSVRPDRIPWN
jgi:hypothetical protein